MNQPGTETPTQETTAGQKPKWLLPALSVLLILLILLGIFLLRQMGRPLTEADVRPIEGEPLTQGQVRPLDPGDSLVGGNPSEVPDGPNLTGQPTTEPAPRPEEPRMPEVVARYLEHIRRVEAERQKMTSDLAMGFSMLAEVRGGATLFGEEDKIDSGYQKYIQDWASLSRFFLSVQPPRNAVLCLTHTTKCLPPICPQCFVARSFSRILSRTHRRPSLLESIRNYRKNWGLPAGKCPPLLEKLIWKRIQYTKNTDSEPIMISQMTLPSHSRPSRQFRNTNEKTLK